MAEPFAGCGASHLLDARRRGRGELGHAAAERSHLRSSDQADPAMPAVHDPEQLYVDLAPAVLGYIRAQGASDPEDMLGDVFVNVVKDLPRFVGDHLQARRWVFTIAHARIVDDRRRRRRRPATLAAFPADRAVHEDAPTFTDPELVAALRALTPDQRDVVALRFVADLPIGEVAAILGKSPAPVKAQQHRALNRLAALLGSAAGFA